MLASHCGCSWFQRPSGPKPPMLPQSPTLEELIDRVNRNSARIGAFYTNRAILSIEGFPSLRADIAYQYGRRFRLRAHNLIGSTEVDLGSNDELFWVWIKRNQPPAVFFARHDQFANSPVQQSVPIDPQWLVEALGVVRFDPAVEHKGPVPSPGGRFEVRSFIHSPSGEMTKITVIDIHGWVLEQHLYNAQGKLLASAIASNHAFDPVSGISLPRNIEIRWPSSSRTLSITLNELHLNQLDDNSTALWEMPKIPTQYIDMTHPPKAQTRRSQPTVQAGRF